MHDKIGCVKLKIFIKNTLWVEIINDTKGEGIWVSLNIMNKGIIFRKHHLKTPCFLFTVM